MKPFITWADMTVKNYFICSVLLIAGILAVWWMISNITALFICNELAGGLFIAALLCLPYFGLMIFPELHLSVPFFISTLTISTVIYYSHMWFTDLGCYTIIEYQEVLIIIAHLAVSALIVVCGIKYFKMFPVHGASRIFRRQQKGVPILRKSIKSSHFKVTACLFVVKSLLFLKQIQFSK